MEPRVVNLLLSESLPSERNGLDHLLQFPSTAVFPSSTLPAIRPLDEDQCLESRDFRNQIDSLQLREIDWDALESPIYVRPSSSSAIASNAARAEEAPVKKGIKSAAPIAGVLNSISPEVRNEETGLGFQVQESRKRRRIDAPSTRILPKPSPSTKKGSKRQRIPPLLPPLLVPLHEPPPDARIIPSINTDGFRERLGELPTPEARQTERENAFNIQSERADKSCAVAEQPTLVEKPVVVVSAKPAKNTKGRNKWTEEETAHLLRGVARLGIGNWKKILQDPEFHFNGRTAVDLKDRFRTCCPDDYRNSTPNKSNKPELAAKENAEPSGPSSSQPHVTIRAPGVERKGAQELAKLGISAPFPKSQRRARRGFTVEEDEALMRGFNRYGAQWTKIRSDPELGLTSRRRTDLRDRFRNRYPDKFVEAGHKFHPKKLEDAKEPDPPPSSDPSKAVDDQQSTSRAEDANTHHTLTTSASKDEGTQYSLRLLTSSMTEPYFTDIADLTPDGDEDPETITLSRNIFDWADQQTNHNINKTAPSRYDAPAEPSKTLSRLDQFNINPMLALKVPTAGLQSTGSTSSLPNLFPPLPLSGILNGPVSLPPPADLVSGHDAEGRVEV